MGKKAKLKQIRRIASTLPKIETGVVIGTPISGAELYKKGVTEVGGKPIIPNGRYTERTVQQKPLNHNRLMKKLYNERGIAGVAGYVQAVEEYTEKMKQVEPAEPGNLIENK